jgi:hypothetical protein
MRHRNERREEWDTRSRASASGVRPEIPRFNLKRPAGTTAPRDAPGYPRPNPSTAI